MTLELVENSPRFNLSCLDARSAVSEKLGGMWRLYDVRRKVLNGCSYGQGFYLTREPGDLVLSQLSVKEPGQQQLTVAVNVHGSSNPSVFD